MVVLCACMVFPCAVPAFAEVYNPYDYGTVTIDGQNEVVTITDYYNSFFWQRFHNDQPSVEGHGTAFSYDTQMRYVDNDQIYLYVFGDGGYLDIRGVPSGSKINFALDVETSVTVASQTYEENYTIYWQGYDSSYAEVSKAWGLKTASQYTTGYEPRQYQLTMDISTDSLAGCSYIKLWVVWDFAGVANENDTTKVSVFAGSQAMSLVVPYSQLYQLQAQGEETNRLLTDIETALESNGQTLDDILKQQEANGDKLDDMNQNIESLPGEIGDQMQGIIDNEKDEAKNEGNKFVDQILDALPDSSQEVLAALKSLPDAMAYTGTDAVLQIPSLVMPAVGDLIPETELWSGGELDFAEYVEMLPSTLLQLVQALFTIAIVLYGVYELKGIISYCLTLRESKGG